MKLLGAHNVVALEHTHRAMSCDLHGCSLTHTRVRQVPNRGATQIVRSETFVLIPLRPRLLSNPDFNTPLNPLTLEIRHVEYRTARLEFLLEHHDEFAGQGKYQWLPVLDNTRR